MSVNQKRQRDLKDQTLGLVAVCVKPIKGLNQLHLLVLFLGFCEASLVKGPSEVVDFGQGGPFQLDEQLPLWSLHHVLPARNRYYAWRRTFPS